MPLRRRQLLKTGIVGGAVLTLVGTSYGTFWGDPAQPAREGGYAYQFVSQREYGMLQQLVPVLLGPALKQGSMRAQHIESTIQGIDLAISGFTPAMQAEVRQLFSLLTFAPSRMVLIRQWQGWSQADPAHLETLLHSWRTSELSLLRVAYEALQQITMAAWYGNPTNWSVIGYAGPPAYVPIS